MTQQIEIEKRDKVTIITINRPEVRNALNQESLTLLYNAFHDLSSAHDTRVIVLKGAGSEAFCAGADLRELQQAKNIEQREAFFLALSKVIQAMHAAPQTIIALVHGFALAGGCGLAAAADIVLAAEDASFGLPELHIGLVPMVVMPVLHRAIGRRALNELVLSADRIDAERARQIGLVSHVIDKNKLEEHGLALAEKISSLAPEALRSAKELLYQVGEADYLESLRSYPKKIAALSMRAEALEGISAFLEKRKPNW